MRIFFLLMAVLVALGCTSKPDKVYIANPKPKYPMCDTEFVKDLDVLSASINAMPTDRFIETAEYEKACSDFKTKHVSAKSICWRDPSQTRVAFKSDAIHYCSRVEHARLGFSKKIDLEIKIIDQEKFKEVLGLKVSADPKRKSLLRGQVFETQISRPLIVEGCLLTSDGDFGAENSPIFVRLIRGHKMPATFAFDVEQGDKTMRILCGYDDGDSDPLAVLRRETEGVLEIP